MSGFVAGVVAGRLVCLPRRSPIRAVRDALVCSFPDVRVFGSDQLFEVALVGREIESAHDLVLDGGEFALGGGVGLPVFTGAHLGKRDVALSCDV